MYRSVLPCSERREGLAELRVKKDGESRLALLPACNPAIVQHFYVRLDYGRGASRAGQINQDMGPFRLRESVAMKARVFRCGQLNLDSVVGKKDRVVSRRCPFPLNIFAGAVTFIRIIPAAGFGFDCADGRHEENVGVPVVFVMRMAEASDGRIGVTI